VKDALQSVIDGRQVAIREKPSDGCKIEFPEPTDEEKDADKAPNYADHIVPILKEKCYSCHTKGGVAADYPLYPYNKAKALAGTIKRVTEYRRMPPWGADDDPEHSPKGGFLNDRSLSEEQIETIRRWAKGGKKPGDLDKVKPPPPVNSGEWQIGTPDAQFSISQGNGGRAFRVPASGTLNYQYFTVKTNFKEEVCIDKVEVHPGAKATKVVHHSIVHITGAPGDDKVDFGAFIRNLGTLKRVYFNYPKEMREGKKGWNLLFDLYRLGQLYDDKKASILGSYVPGEPMRELPEGTAICIPPGATLTFEMHYTPNGTSVDDDTTVGVKFFKKGKKPERVVRTNPLDRLPFNVAAGDPHHAETKVFEFDTDSEILSLQPHAHRLGKDFKYTLKFPNGEEEVILSVPNYDFNWQTIYTLKEPLRVPKGTKLIVTAHWDNSAWNRHADKPLRNVHWGFQTEEEMFNGWVTYVPLKGKK
jgi:hypothetical protein